MSVPSQGSKEQRITIPATVLQAMTSQAQPKDNPKSFRPPKTPVGQWLQAKLRSSLSISPHSNKVL